MRHLLCAVVLVGVAAGRPVFAHHSSANYDTTRLVEIEGVIDSFAIIAPHSLLIVKGDDGGRYTAEWLAPTGMQRAGITHETLSTGDRVVLGGNPRRDFEETHVVNFKSVRRLSDGWKFPNRS